MSSSAPQHRHPGNSATALTGKLADLSLGRAPIAIANAPKGPGAEQTADAGGRTVLTLLVTPDKKGTRNANGAEDIPDTGLAQLAGSFESTVRPTPQ